MKKAFTLIELLIVITIIVIFAGLVCRAYYVFGGIVENNGEYNSFFFPIEAAAQAQQRQVRATEEQNKLLKELLEKRENNH